MQNKTNPKNRDDLKVVITATALTLTLAFWNLFSKDMPNPVHTATPEPAAPIMMEQGKILLGGPPPKTTIVIQQSGGSQPRNQQNRPKPVTNTSSSK